MMKSMKRKDTDSKDLPGTGVLFVSIPAFSSESKTLAVDEAVAAVRSSVASVSKKLYVYCNVEKGSYPVCFT